MISRFELDFKKQLACCQVMFQIQNIFEKVQFQLK
jgi:hypothetical protein